LIQQQDDGSKNKKNNKDGRTFILCLDKSGSMAGTPYNALKEGAKVVGKAIFENDEFEYFATVYYDSIVTAVVP